MTQYLPFSADQPGPDPVFSYMRVDELRVNDMVDLENDKYADPDPTNLASPWQFEYATIFNMIPFPCPAAQATQWLRRIVVEHT